MPEVLFRGIPLGRNEYITGSLIKLSVGKHVHYYILPENAVTVMDLLEVDPNTIGQYTGLNDIDGEMIFTGDYVVPTCNNRLSNKPALVKYDPISGYWMCNPKRKPRIIKK